EGEYEAPQAGEALKYFDKNISPTLTQIATLRGDCSEPWQHIKKQLHMPRPVMNFLNSLRNIDDDAKLDHYLLALFDGLEHLGYRRPVNLLTMAEDGSDLPPALRGDGGFEASEEELAKQSNRPSTEKTKAEAETAAETQKLRKPTHGDTEMREAVH
ncbi:MAG: hypothetical protein AAFY81_07805, partial [Pseudomonadota bacterium]